MKKGVRGQTTIFIIIAIVILGGVAISLLAFKNPSSSSGDFSANPDVQAQFNNIRGSIQNCIQYVSEDAVDIVGMQGGYYVPPEKDSFDLVWISIPYYYDMGRFLMPSDAEISKQLGLYVNDNIPDCLGEINFSGFTLDYSNKPVTSAVLNKRDVVFKIDMPVTIAREGKTYRLNLKDNEVVVDSKLSEMMDIAKYITDSHRQDPDRICITCVEKMASERKMRVDIMNFNEDKATSLIVISSSSNETANNKPPFIFEFLNRYEKIS